MLHAADINPSEDDRELMLDLLQLALKDTESKEKETENILKKARQKMDPDAVKDLERDEIHLKRHIKLIEDAMAKTERTSGHTLKKAYNKKLIVVLKAMMTPAKYQELEALLTKNGLCHQHPVHHYGHHHGHGERAGTPVEAH